MNIIEANRHHIEAALEYSGGTHTFQDVADAIIAGRMQIWPGQKSMAVTEIIEYARKKVLHIFLAGGDMEELIDMIDSAAQWGRTQGCTSLTMSGRRGWERVLGKHGFQPVMIVMERAIE
jgi:uncharacterized protein (UPF0548 family)